MPPRCGAQLSAGEQHDGYTPQGLYHIELMDVSTLTIYNKWYHRVYGLPPRIVFVVDRVFKELECAGSMWALIARECRVL